MRTGGQTTVYGSSDGGTCARGGREVLRLAVALAMTLVLVWCGGGMRGYAYADEVAGGTSEGEAKAQTVDLSNAGDSDNLRTMETVVYDQLIDELGESGYIISDVQATYVSQEYLDEVAYNSQANIYFGYTLAEVEEVFDGSPYVFTLGDDGQTTVEAFEDYDDTFDQVVHNLAVGGGVILLCATISLASVPLAPAVSIVFACAADQALTLSVSSGVIGATIGGIVTGVQTGDPEAALKSAALAGSDGFRFGAISGAVLGGVEGVALVNDIRNVVMIALEDAAEIQKDSKYSTEVISYFRNTEEYYEVYKTAGLTEKVVNNSKALVREIDLTYYDAATGMTNLERMQKGLAAIDSTTQKAYELHHIGQYADSPLAILTTTEHDASCLHTVTVASEVEHGNAWAATRTGFWKSLAKQLA